MDTYLKRNICFFKVALCLAFFCMAVLAAESVRAGSITDDVKTTVDKVITIMQDPAFALPEKQAERDRRIHAAVQDKFDWQEMAVRTLGPHWRTITPEEQKEFVKIFNAFLERIYIAKVDLFLKETKDFTLNNIFYLKETIAGSYAMVESKIIATDEEIPLKYKLINKNGVWVAYDISIDGVGLVANYRAQFNDILAGASFKELLERLKAK